MDRSAWWSKWRTDHQEENMANMGRGDAAQGDVYNDRRQSGGSRPRRTDPRPKGNKSVPMEAYPGERDSQ